MTFFSDRTYMFGTGSPSVHRPGVVIFAVLRAVCRLDLFPMNRVRTTRHRELMRAAPGWGQPIVYTMGHSTRPLTELITTLESVGVRTLADIRTVPRSRTNPQFNASRLASALPKRGIAYRHIMKLGGLRRSKKGTTENAAWHNASFRAYADYMQADAFREGLNELKRLTLRGQVAAMCAEGNPWRCHRNLLADALLVLGADVRELTAPGKWQHHELIPFARVQGRKVTYPLNVERSQIEKLRLPK